MKKITLEWIEFAERDWATANRESAVETDPNYQAVTFHCQQSAEKYLKAYIQEKGIRPRRIHDLGILLDEIIEFEPALESLRESCAALTNFAVTNRYPGSTTTKDDADDAVRAGASVREVLRKLFDLTEPGSR